MIALPNGEPYVGQIKFHRCDAPATIGSTIVTGLHDGLVVQTEANGSFETELKAGVYKLQIAGSPAAKIHLIDDDATYELQTLGVPGFSAYTGTGGGAIVVQAVDFAVQGIAGLRLLTQHVDQQIRNLAYLTFAGDTQGGAFIYEASSMADDDSVDVAKPNDVLDASPGRWHRQSNLN
jgi:hypothetical protein